jgi:hypothetical protein
MDCKPGIHLLQCVVLGANAMLRRAALADISEIVYERGYPIKRYIHDHTLVEDTESAIDLVLHGWQIYNYPERLSYSATPSDFGALVIQRRRWANGPLLIVPKLLKYAIATKDRFRKLPEVFLRLYWPDLGLLGYRDGADGHDTFHGQSALAVDVAGTGGGAILFALRARSRELRLSMV